MRPVGAPGRRVHGGVQRRDSEGRSITSETRLCDGGREAAPRSAATPVSDRSCGPCTLCCRVLEIQVLGKPAGILCRHNTGTGCGIYRERPEICARWHCLWRRVGALPDALRPDRSGVIFSLDSRPPAADAPEGACIVGRAVGDPQDLDRPETVEGFAMFVREGSLPVWKVSGRAATLLHPGLQLPPP
ncbi:hypothetical protein MKK75_13345 [Methylobacterium sp. J-030]|uniref:hypothetical protein n=1 Tax=Methylobacterium sp. J-030 TaxID=2836627 RepID=UPI001FB9B041|nr:hypothetical protein [Methylobacterium sp. J-030]MCJ2069763.1 hypothetical protein [Methylobacterium sp. J-030]